MPNDKRPRNRPRKDAAPLASPALLTALDRITAALNNQARYLDDMSHNTALIDARLAVLQNTVAKQNQLLERILSDAAYDAHIRHN